MCKTNADMSLIGGTVNCEGTGNRTPPQLASGLLLFSSNVKYPKFKLC